MRWIDAKKRKPEVNVSVFGWCAEESNVLHVQWDGEDWVEVYYGQEIYEPVNISHWMPEPEGPKMRAR